MDEKKYDNTAKDKKICFTLPKKQEGQGKSAGRAMSFGDDFNTRVFRNFVDFMIKYKMYAEYLQKNNWYLDPQIERFLKVEMGKLRN